MAMRWQRVTEWAGFQLVWFACALGAAQGRTLPGVLAASVFLAAVLGGKHWNRAECLTVVASGALGLIVETALVASGLVRFAAPWPHPDLSPAWMVALWMAFGATLTALASLLGQPLIAKAGVAGCIAGPLAYWAGAKAGALEISGAASLTYVVIAALWALALPGLMLLRLYLGRRLERP